MSETFPRGVEAVASTLITNDAGEVLLIQSPKWGDSWLIPGGHIEPGETAMEAAKREGMEETGLELEVSHLVNIGELINDPAFHRRCHLVYLHFVCHARTDVFNADEREVHTMKWFDPKEALALPLAEGIKETIQNYIADMRIPFVSKLF